MTELDPELLTGAMADALETMAFISPLPWEGDVPAPPERGLVVSIRHHTDRTRTCRLMAGERFALHLAANVLGVAEGDHDATERAMDALKELMNVVSGALLRAAHVTSSAVLALDLPCVESIVEPGRWRDLLGAPGTVCFDADGHFIAIGLVDGE